MEERIKKLRLLASTNSKRFLEELRDLIQEWKSLKKTGKKKFESDIRSLEKVGNDLFLNLYTKRAKSNDNVISAIEKRSVNVFDKGNLKLNTLKLREMLSLIQDDNTDKALKVMDSISSNVKSRGETILNTLLIANNRAKVIENAKKRGINQLRYEGPTGALSRDFCKSRVGKVYTIEEIELMDNQQRLPVLYFCGGYNCRHRWVVVIEPKVIENIKNSELKYSETDINQDTRKHAPKFGLNQEEYIKEAQSVVRNAKEYYKQERKGCMQYVFVGYRGYVITKDAGTIKGYFYHDPKYVTEAVENLKIKKNWGKL